MVSYTSNTALYVNRDLVFETCHGMEISKPADGELLIQNSFSGANPADMKHATYLGIYPTVLGYDFCGVVLQTPPGSRFKVGEQVAGFTPTGLNRLERYGAHQSFLACPEDMAFSVPSNLPAHHAATLTVVLMTAADAIFNILKFPLPQENPGTKTKGPLFIWASEITAALRETGYEDITHGFDTIGDLSGEGSANTMAKYTAENTELVLVVMQQNQRFKMPLAVMNADVTLHPRGLPEPITIPARLDDHQNAWQVLQWAVQNCGAKFRMPAVEVFVGTAEESLEELTKLDDHKRGFGKLVLQHPLA
ncbi:Polyketide synthase, enoylreductase [Penicillium expansum]|nr:Polyketide synthase, enoylreductase [Penicillium expansum]KGO72267.1 Polyketide synthase, enoylreductase [Penicillium expansum]